MNELNNLFCQNGLSETEAAILSAVAMQHIVCVYVFTEVGFSLRKDDPTTLRQMLVDIHSKSTSVDVTAFNDP